MKKLIMLLMSLMLSVSVVSCNESKTENAIEDAGEAVERTAEDAGDAVEETYDRAENEAENLAD